MKLVKSDIKPMMVRAMCECGGEFKPNGIVLTTYPEQYPHKCDRCGKLDVFYCEYPKVEYEEV